MNKMIVIIDEPNDCYECPLLKRTFGLFKQCTQSKNIMDSIDLTKRPDWCPLREIPEKRKERKISEYEFGKIGYAFANGWNACLKAILGE